MRLRHQYAVQLNVCIKLRSMVHSSQSLLLSLFLSSNSTFAVSIHVKTIMHLTSLLSTTRYTPCPIHSLPPIADPNLVQSTSPPPPLHPRLRPSEALQAQRQKHLHPNSNNLRHNSHHNDLLATLLSHRHQHQSQHIPLPKTDHNMRSAP